VSLHAQTAPHRAPGGASFAGTLLVLGALAVSASRRNHSHLGAQGPDGYLPALLSRTRSRRRSFCT